MRAVIFAAGLGRRLGEWAPDVPKILLRFGERSLLERHLTQLAAVGVEEITLGVGHGAAHIEAELARLQEVREVRLASINAAANALAIPAVRAETKEEESDEADEED